MAKLPKSAIHDPYNVLSASAPHKRKQGPKHHSRSYPRGVGLDFRKLGGLTLANYIDHHGVSVRPEAPPSELAVAVARHFEGMEVDEEETIGGFLERLEKGSSATTEYTRQTQYYDGSTCVNPSRRRSKLAARPGEQVAAKVTRTDENGSWILASVQRFYPDTDTYDVQDEDDTSKLIRLPWSHVMRLSTGAEGCFQKGADCMAIFPETTSFYKAKVSQNPVWKLPPEHAISSSNQQSLPSLAHGGSNNNTNAMQAMAHSVPVLKEIVVRFEDDEDSTGKTPHRRVPSRYVIPVPSQYFYDETEDIDLTPPGNK
mmetsp:Transcript_12226/g.35099  ORF Transcript_12226/g.35099 Transcript_12226/m.35099 type:complete len:314 (+) Transcript_12226:104-1045(+)